MYRKINHVLSSAYLKYKNRSGCTGASTVTVSSNPTSSSPVHPVLKDNFPRNSLEIVPKILHQTWANLPLPQYMEKNVALLRSQNEDFQYCFYSDEDCRCFIKDHFPADVSFAFDHLRPGAFRADLFRYCVLYILGGVYLDIKFSCVSNFKLRYLCTWEQVYVRDRDVSYGTAGVYQGLLVSLPLNPILASAIRDVVRTVCSEEISLNRADPLLLSGARCLAYTGPLLLSQNFLEYDKQQWDFRFDSVIFYKNRVVLKEYPQYRREQHQHHEVHNTLHYRALCNQGLVYNVACLKSPLQLFSRNEERVFQVQQTRVRCFASSACVLYDASANCYTLVQRWVNYKYNSEGVLVVPSPQNRGVSCNTLVTLDAQLQNVVQEKLLSDNWEATPQYPWRGVEDVRLYKLHDTVYMTGTNYCPLNQGPRAVVGVFDGVSVAAPLVIMPFDSYQWQKNWVLCTYRDHLALIYKWFPLTVARVNDGKLDVLYIEHRVPRVLREARGSSSASYLGSHAWFVVHRTLQNLQGRRSYQHMFVVLQASDFTFCARSQYFTFTENNKIEFCLGLVVSHASVVLSYSARDSHSYVARYSWDRLRELKWFDLTDNFSECPFPLS